MTQSLNEGRIMQHQERTPANTTPTTLEEFARQVFVPAFHGAGQPVAS